LLSGWLKEVALRAVGHVRNMDKMFYYTWSFDQDLGDWALDSVTDMYWMFYEATAFNQDLDWCIRDGVDIENAFKQTKCEETSCGVAMQDVFGICEPWAHPCLIGTDKQCDINSPTLIIIIVLVLLVGYGACVCCRKKKDETYAAAARRVLYCCLCCSCFCCRKKTERSNVESRPDSPAELLPEEATAPKEEEATDVAPEAEESLPEALAEEPLAPPAKSWWFRRKESEPEPEEAEEALAEELPAPPAKSWFGRAEPEPESEEAERPPPPAKSWRFWGAEPEPGEAEPPLSPFSALRAERERELKTLGSP